MKRTLRRRLAKRLYDRGWMRSEMDDTLRSRFARGVNDMTRWYDWGHFAMWMAGRYDSGSAGAPRGRDMWWIPVEYVEGIAASLVADFDQRYGCFITTSYEQVRTTRADIDWRIFDLQDDGRDVVIGLWPNREEHGGRIQPMPTWHHLGARREMRLFLWWYLWQHKAKAQWFGLRTWVWSRGLHAAVHSKKPFACQVVPERGSGGYSHWHCERRKFHRGAHRYRNYIWPGPGSRVEYDPQDVAS